jgi:hypothetical protein
MKSIVFKSISIDAGRGRDVSGGSKVRRQRYFLPQNGRRIFDGIFLLTMLAAEAKQRVISFGPWAAEFSRAMI